MLHVPNHQPANMFRIINQDVAVRSSLSDQASACLPSPRALVPLPAFHPCLQELCLPSKPEDVWRAVAPAAAASPPPIQISFWRSECGYKHITHDWEWFIQFIPTMVMTGGWFIIVIPTLLGLARVMKNIFDLCPCHRWVTGQVTSALHLIGG